MATAEDALARLVDPVAKVSAHWLVHEDGRLVRLVPEARRAWHAGLSGWRGRPLLNDSSIGIEIVNPGHEWGYRPFPERQIDALVELCGGIVRRWPIPPDRVLAHSDVAPHRKEDPGELFPWDRLIAAGIALAAAPRPLPGVSEPAELLRRIGYPLDLDGVDLAAALRAFQRRWRPGRIDGLADPETCRLLGCVAASVEALQVAGLS